MWLGRFQAPKSKTNKPKVKSKPQVKTYRLISKQLQSEMAYKSGLQHKGKPLIWPQTKTEPSLFTDTAWYTKKWRKNCACCGSRLICNGCSNCGLCDKKSLKT